MITQKLCKLDFVDQDMFISFPYFFTLLWSSMVTQKQRIILLLAEILSLITLGQKGPRST